MALFTVKKTVPFALVALNLACACGADALTDGQVKYAAMRQYDALVSDIARPRWHLASPDGGWWDVNAAFEVDGRYHVSFLRDAMTPDGKRAMTPEGMTHTWGHATSRDLFHWRFLADSLRIVEAAKTPSFYSGHSVYGAPKPTLIVYVRGRGVFVAQSVDASLEKWAFINRGEPVIPSAGPDTEYMVFDPFAWYDREKGTYFALVGNANRRKGYLASPSLFSSKDLVRWEYLGPILKEDPRWLTPQEDSACVDLFPLGGRGKWVMVAHVHSPYSHVRCMVGEFDGRTFTPEQIIRIGSLHTVAFGPETFYDSVKKRRILFSASNVRSRAWAVAATQPVELRLSDDDQLEFYPVEELSQLLYGEKSFPDFSLADGVKTLEGAGSRSMLVDAWIDLKTAQSAGFDLACAPDGSEYVRFAYLPSEKIFRVDFSSSRKGADNTVIRYDPGKLARLGLTQERTAHQDTPFELKPGEKLHLQIFRDGALFEVFLNNRAFVVQPAYSSSEKSVGVRAFAEGGAASFEAVKTADIDASMSL